LELHRAEQHHEAPLQGMARLNGACVAVQAEHGYVPAGVLREAEMHAAFASNSLTMLEYQRLVQASICSAVQGIGEGTARDAVAAAGGDSSVPLPPGLRAPDGSIDVSAADPDCMEHMSTAMRSLWDSALPGSAVRQRIEVILKVCMAAVQSCDDEVLVMPGHRSG